MDSNINQKLLQAVQAKKLGSVMNLINRGACPFQKGVLDERGYTILMVAIDHGDKDLEIVKTLIKHTPVKNIYLEGSNNQTALMLAAEKGLDEIVRLLLAKSGTKAAKSRRLDLMNKDGWNAFALAGKNHHLSTMKILAEAGIMTTSIQLMQHVVQLCNVDLAITLAQDYQYDFGSLSRQVETLNHEIYIKQDFLIFGLKLAIESGDKKLLAMFMGLYNKTEISPELIQRICIYAIEQGMDNIVRLLAPYLINNINLVIQPYGTTMVGLAVQLNRPGAFIELIRVGASCKILACSSRIKAVLAIAATQANAFDLISLLVSDISTTGKITPKVLNESFIAAIKMRSDICALYLMQEGIAQKDLSLLEYVNEKGENGIALAGQYNCVGTINRCFGMARKNQMMMVDLSTFFEQALLNAARCGSLEVAKFLIYMMIFAECMDANGNTPIMLASENGHDSIVIELIKAEAYLNKYNKFGKNALTLAIENNHELIAMMLLKARVNVLYVNSEGQTLLMSAAKKGLSHVTEILVKEYGLQTDAICKKGLNALMYASIEGHTQMVNCLIKVGTNIEQQDFSHKTAFDHAFENKKASVLMCLIRAGAKFDFQNQDVNFIFKQCGAYFQEGIINLFIQALIVPDELQIKPLNDAFALAVTNNISKVIEPFIRLGARLDYRVQGNVTLMGLCVYHHNLDSFELLLSHGASIDELEEDSMTLMYVAAQLGNLLMVKRLKQLNSSLVDKPCSSGHPPVFVAARYDHAEVVQFLLTEGQSSYLNKTVHGQALLHFSASNGSYKTVKVLLELGVDIDAKNQDGFTGLTVAANADNENRNQDNLVRVAEIFIERKCNIYLEFRGQNAMGFAIEHDNLGMAARILCAYSLEKIKFLLNNPDYKAFVESFIKNLNNSQDQIFKVLGSMWVDDKEKPAPFLSLPMELRAKILSYNDYASWYEHRNVRDIKLAIEKINRMIENRRAENKDTPPAIIFSTSLESVNEKPKEGGLLAYKKSMINMDIEQEKSPVVIFSSKCPVIQSNKRKHEEEDTCNTSAKRPKLLQQSSGDDESKNEAEFNHSEKSKSLKTVYRG